MHIVNALRAHTRLNGARAMLLLNLEQKRKKALDGVGIDIVTIRPLTTWFCHVGLMGDHVRRVFEERKDASLSSVAYHRI